MFVSVYVFVRVHVFVREHVHVHVFVRVHVFVHVHVQPLNYLWLWLVLTDYLYVLMVILNYRLCIFIPILLVFSIKQTDIVDQIVVVSFKFPQSHDD